MDVTGTPEKASAIRQELTRFEEARKGSADLQELYANPAIEFDNKMKITRSIAKRQGLSEMAVKVLEVVVGNHRINDLGVIIEALAEMIRHQTGTVAAEVRAARPLNDQETSDLRRALEKKVGRKVELVVTTDETLIGGFVAKVGSQVYNASIVGKIQKFRESLG